MKTLVETIIGISEESLLQKQTARFFSYVAYAPLDYSSFTKLEQSLYEYSRNLEFRKAVDFDKILNSLWNDHLGTRQKQKLKEEREFKLLNKSYKVYVVNNELGMNFHTSDVNQARDTFRSQKRYFSCYPTLFTYLQGADRKSVV